MVEQENQDAIWRKVRYRGPDDFVVRSYALPKLDLIESVLPLQGLSVLDVGCGPAVFSVHLAKRARLVLGTDISSSFVQRAKGMEIVLANALKLPFVDKSFDIVFEANLLHHIDVPLGVLHEMARVARKAVVLIEPNRNNPLMFGFAVVKTHERGLFKFSRRYLEGLIYQTGLRAQLFWTTGMISQNNTPAFLIPFLRKFDFDFPLGEYHVVVAMKHHR